MATRVRSGLQLKQVDDKHKSSVFASDHQTTVLTCHLFFVFTNNEPLHLHQMIYIHQSHHSSGSSLHFNMSPTPQAFLHQPEEEQNPKPTPVHFKARHKIINLSLGLFFFFFSIHHQCGLGQGLEFKLITNGRYSKQILGLVTRLYL